MIRRLIGLLIMFALTANGSVPAEAGYTPGRAWNAAQQMKELGILQGRPHVGLVPNETLTRAEMVTMLVRALGREGEAHSVGRTAFPDTGGHWANGYVEVGKSILQEHGEQLGYEDGTFRPDDAVTPVEMTALLLKFLGVRPVSGPAWPDNYVQAAVSTGVIEQGDESFCGGEPRSAAATRGCLFYHADRAFKLIPIDREGRSVYERHHNQRIQLFTVYGAEENNNHFIVHTSLYTLTGEVDTTATVTAAVNGAAPSKVAVTSRGGWYHVAGLRMGANTVEFQAILPGGRVEQVTITLEMMHPR